MRWHISVATILSGILFSSTAAAPALISLPTTSQADPKLWNLNSNITPEPIRSPLGATILGPQDVPVALQNADALAPPTTDSGQVFNMKWSFSLSPNRLANVSSLLGATDIAGINMRLEPGAIRELHWYNTAEAIVPYQWAYVLKDDVRITTVTPEGQVYIGDVTEGDIWYFAAGNPHSIQAKNTTDRIPPRSFAEDNTFLLTDWLAHVPKEVLAFNFGQNLNVFDHIPEKQFYIFPCLPPVLFRTPSPTAAGRRGIGYGGPQQHPQSVHVRALKGGRHQDPRRIDQGLFSAIEATVEVGGMRSWYPTEPEWNFFISGQARVTVFAASSKARTYDFQAGDVGYVPPSFGLFKEISLTQWLALTPPELVKAHLGFSEETIMSESRQT
ncbi:RmlC-like cupin domain-containing protein [Mycena epipterygia]|nr:RmlC-like cupin domain-containing protein [Mycena epipterygia]